MKLLLYSDCHFSQYSSIIRGRGDRFSVRLENLIKSVNWAENLAYDNKCDAVICLGDFFDTSTIDAETCVALQDIEWSPLPHYFLVGNHEMYGDFSSTHILNLHDRIQVINSNISKIIDDCEICYLPYTQKYDSIKNIFGEYKSSKRIILSHNDISGISYGGFVSSVGFDVHDIEDNCDIMFNGHLHNGGYASSKIYNVGNLTGQNFSEDAFKYNHNAIILDTESLQFEIHENPHAFNFYKLDLIDVDLTGAGIELDLKDNAVVTVKTRHKIDDIKILNKHIVACRCIVEHAQSEEQLPSIQLNDVDHLKQFTKFILENVGQSDEIVYELSEVCK